MQISSDFVLLLENGFTRRRRLPLSVLKPQFNTDYNRALVAQTLPWLGITPTGEYITSLLAGEKGDDGLIGLTSSVQANWVSGCGQTWSDLRALKALLIAIPK
jgi:hypothetical protein